MEPYNHLFDDVIELNRWYNLQASRCHCDSIFAPCDGVMSGGVCDNLQSSDEEYYLDYEAEQEDEQW